MGMGRTCQSIEAWALCTAVKYDVSAERVEREGQELVRSLLQKSLLTRDPRVRDPGETS